MKSDRRNARVSRAVIDSPLGPLTLLASGGALTGLYLDGRAPVPAEAVRKVGNHDAPVPAQAEREANDQHAPVPAEAEREANDQDALVLAEAERQLEEYFAGRRRSFDLPLALEGTAFQRRVWEALLNVGYGETVTYGQLADQLGQPTAARAVGLANGRNPVSIIVPCHRVIGSNGSLTGYGGGISNKQRLLDLERGVRTIT